VGLSSEVLPVASVAVAVMIEPSGTSVANSARYVVVPSAAVVTAAAPIHACALSAVGLV
jgi:hypothetical protein